MIEYWYICDVNPVPWQIGPVGATRGKTGRIAGYVGRDQELFTYQQAIKEELAKQSPVMLDGDVMITCYFWRSRVAGWDVTTGRRQKKSQADCTNMIKSTEDACQGVLFRNDKGNVSSKGYIIAQGEQVQGRVLICVAKAEPSYPHDVLMEIPDQVYTKMMGGEEQLILQLNQPNETLAHDYGDDEQDEDLPF